MFGIKKAINLSFNNNNDSETNNQSSNYNTNDDLKYIYYEQNDNEDLFISQLEIYIKPNNYPDKKLLVVAKKDVNFKDLYKQIEENFKSKPEFKTISNLRIRNFTKIEGEQKVKLPADGKIDEYLKSGDIIYCDILSEEQWIKTYYRFEVKSFRKVIKIEYKILKRLSFRMIKFILLKAGISLFYDEMRNNNIDNTFNYYLKDILFNKKRKKPKDINENSKEYRLEVFVNMHFEIFEELIHEQLISNRIDKKESIYFRFNEYSNLSFDELITSIKFSPELETIKDISKEYLTSQFNDIKTPFLFFNPKNPEVFEDFFFSSIDNISSDIDLDEVDDDSNFFSDDRTFSLGPDYKLRSSTFSTSNEIQYKPDANMIIISLFLNIADSRNSSLTNIRNSIDSNQSDLSIDDNKNNVSMIEERKRNNPLNDSLFGDIKKVNKSLLFPDDTDINIDIKNDSTNKKEYEIIENIFISDDDDSKNRSKKDSCKTGRKSYQIKTKKKYKFFLKNYKQPDCSNDLYELFNQKDFLTKIKQNYNFLYSKMLIERMKVPESRNMEIRDKNFFKYMYKREKKKKESIFKYHKKLTIFLIINLIFFGFILLFINYDFFDNYIS